MDGMLYQESDLNYRLLGGLICDQFALILLARASTYLMVLEWPQFSFVENRGRFITHIKKTSVPHLTISKAQCLRHFTQQLFRSFKKRHPWKMVRDDGRSENRERGASSNVVGRICPPGWDRVNWSAKIWGGPPTGSGIPASLICTALNQWKNWMTHRSIQWIPTKSCNRGGENVRSEVVINLPLQFEMSHYTKVCESYTTYLVR